MAGRGRLPLLVGLGAVLLAALLRFPLLAGRPMHGDEAIQAFKSFALKAHGEWRYDPELFHGPALAWLTLPGLLLPGTRTIADTGEVRYRAVTALCGVAMVALVPSLAGALGAWGAALGALFLAASPVMAYYARDYIHETPLALFVLAAVSAGWAYASTGRLRWLVLSGAMTGLAAATKETWVISMAAALAALRLSTGRFLPGLRPAVAFAGAAALAFTALLTGFFTRWADFPSALKAASFYARLGTAGGVHEHPWHWYLSTLAWTRYGAGPLFSEAVILALAVVGIGSVLGGRGVPSAGGRFARFLALFTVFSLAAYSAIPYKTPWCALQFMTGACLLAGVGAARLAGLVPGRASRGVAAALLAAAAGHLALTASRACFTYAADNRNPWAYAQPVPDARRLGERILSAAAGFPAGDSTLVKVVTAEQWPLPWYLRRLPNTGWWGSLPDDCDAPIVVSSVADEERLTRRLRGRYSVEYFGLRPSVILVLRVINDE
jgi:uncharacterized protein (TIGR03663 family)